MKGRKIDIISLRIKEHFMCIHNVYYYTRSRSWKWTLTCCGLKFKQIIYKAPGHTVCLCVCVCVAALLYYTANLSMLWPVERRLLSARTHKINRSAKSTNWSNVQKKKTYIHTNTHKRHSRILRRWQRSLALSIFCFCFLLMFVFILKLVNRKAQHYQFKITLENTI